MENNLMNQILFYFSQDGLIFYCKSNEYYKNNQPKFEETMMMKNALESNPQFQNIENRICYLSCCLYLLTKNDEQFKTEFCKKILSNLSPKNNPLNDTFLFLIYNCIDFDENFLHSDKKRLQFLLKYLERFSSIKKTKENYLLYKYYHEILNFRLGIIEEATNESFAIMAVIEEDKDKMTKYIEFIKLKNELFQIKLNEAINEKAQLKENFALLNDVFEKVKNQNPFLALKLGFSIYNNLYNQNLYDKCIPILQQMNQIIKNYEMQGIPQKKMLRFSLSIFCRFGLIGLLLSNKQLVDFSIKEMTNCLIIIKDDRNSKKSMAVFKAYTFALNLLKINCNIYVEKIEGISNIFSKEFILDKFNQEGKYLGDSYCINNQNINQCIINLNTLNNSMDISMNEKARKIVEYYKSNILTPGKNIVSQDTIFTFVIGFHDKIRCLTENYLINKNENEQAKYKSEILNNTDFFWNFINSNIDCEPLLKTEFFKSVIIKIFSTCTHVYFLNKDYNKVSSIIGYFDNLSKKLNINENTPSYELVWKIKGDYYFKKNDYSSSISCYNNSVKRMHDKNIKKPAVYFNLGVLYYYNGDKNSSIENLKKSAEYFKKNEEEKSTFEFHKRNNILNKKYNLTQYIIKEIQNN